MRQKRVKKGEFGYILSGRRRGVVRSVIALAVCLGIFLTGLFLYHSNRSLLSIIAAAGCLPVGWSIVNTVMFYRALPCSEAAHEEIERHRGGLLVQYDLEMTSENENYAIAAATVLDKEVCCYTERYGLDTAAGERHIFLQISQSGYSDYRVKIYTELSGFCERLERLEALRLEKGIDPQAIEDAWEPGTTQTAAMVLRAISL